MKQLIHKVSWFYPWMVWFLGASFFFYKYLVQVSPSVMTHDLMAAFGVHGTGLGHLSACYFYAYLVMQIPVGMLLDKYSPRYLTASAILLCALSTCVFSMTTSLGMACLTRALMGFGAAFAAVSCFKAASLWFAPNRFALISGMYMTAAMLGAVGGQAPLSMLVHDYGWRTALKMIALFGVGLSLVYVLFIRDKPQPRVVKSSQGPSIKFYQLMTNRQAWLLSLYSGLAFAPVSVFGGLWGVPFLQQAYALSPAQAALAVSWIFIGFAFGAPLLGWFSDRLKRRKPMMMFGTALALVSLSMVIYRLAPEAAWVGGLLFCFGFGASGFFISFSVIRELFPWRLTATVLGFMNTFDSVCEAISEPFVGAFLDWMWDGRLDQGVHQFSLHGYQMALSLLLAYLLVAGFLLFFIKETYCKTEVTDADD